jgi:hypothetical protein
MRSIERKPPLDKQPRFCQTVQTTSDLRINVSL